MQDINFEINPVGHGFAHQNNGMEVDQDAEDDDQMEMDVVEQDTITFNQSGSTANYLRATGPDTHLSVEEVLAGIQNSGGSSSSNDSGVVTSDRSAHLIIPSFIVKACQKLAVDGILPFTREKMVREWKEDVKKAIRSVAPVMDCILIRLWVFLFADKDAAQGRVPVGPISIPVIVSKKPGSKTLLVDTMVRRSSRLNPQAKDGFQIVKIKEPASKRRKTASLVIDLDQPPQNAEEAANPIPLDNLRKWGVKCGVPPEELSEDALMQGCTEDQD